MPYGRRQTDEAIEHVVRLRRIERLVDRRMRDEVVSVREFLERLAGPTVRPAEAARLLGISHPAIKRWLDNGEISSVITPQGRREVPLSELIKLLEAVEEVRDEDGGRPVARVIRERRRRSAEAIDIDRLLPPRRPRRHRAAELHALAYHRLIAERLDERVVDDARRRVRRWRQQGRVDPRWADEWERILAMPLPQMARTIGADTTRARELRQTSPFAGVLTEQERRRLVRAVEERGFG